MIFRPRLARLFLLLAVALAIAPGTWVRSRILPESDNRPILHVVRLAAPPARIGETRIAGAWRLDSPNRHFGGYSGLTPLEDGTLLALTDYGRLLRFRRPGGEAPITFRFDDFTHLRSLDKRYTDIEGAARDPVSGTLWVTCEGLNQIERYDARLYPTGAVRPVEMRNWPSNTGPESIVRLSDGRFIVLSEGSPRWFAGTMPGLLFESDPVAGGASLPFRFRPPDGFRPVDTALLPDGRVLILLRQVVLGLPPRFESKLMVADPAEIRADRQWTGRVIAHLAAPLPVDNYEGLTVEQDDGGRLVLWLISDDNRSSLQHTLLLKLLWRPNEKARELPRAPS